MALGEILALILVGALAGTAAATLTGQRKSGWLRNTLIGILGALLGGFIFDALDIGLSGAFSAAITLADLIVAVIGALIVIFIIERLG
jgi:uncharacterized membrane protein YeaQ/YmgE (transglycosylase-associated protein family)